MSAAAKKTTKKTAKKTTRKTAAKKGPPVSIVTAVNGSNVKVHYRGTLNDGTVFDSSYDRGTAVAFTVGSGQMIPGFDNAVEGMAQGEKKTVNLTADQAYGQRIEEAVRDIPKTSFPDDFAFTNGVPVEGSVNGNNVRGIIEEVSDDSVKIDFNHPMAGRDLNFEIELVEVGEQGG